MGTHTVTTPFGRRPMTLGLLASQVTASQIDQEARASKWEVFRDIREAKQALGATDRALAILNALLSFHRADELSAEGSLIVFPSNEQLIRRANGMSPATLRRHLANLVETGLVIRRDSPNGKRFARKGEGGAIDQAYGFDLSPILARAEEFKALAADLKAEHKAYRLAKERLTICRRDVVKMIDAGINEAAPGNWDGFQRRYEAVIARLPRTAARSVVEAICNELEDLWVDVHQTLESFINSQNLNANESQSERHIQNSNPDVSSTDESEHGFRQRNEASGVDAKIDNVHALPNRDLPLGMVVDACPELLTLARDGHIRTWRDFVAAAEQARPFMGISPSAWQEAVEVMGPEKAAVTVAAILQRSDRIGSRGGYLRNLTERARDQKFSVWPMVMALLREKLDAHAKSAGPGAKPGTDHAVGGGVEPVEISDALRKSMKKKGWER
ncbi:MULTISPECIES: plasmid replication protein RepC [unclassified Mesorhizobium]|uniref:plasmid replication protein RepC n=1 Tax=unclassified Mesorhizobium TaxID=325217 RepID=UPI00241521A0|nr:MULTISPECIES: plasmid replication protein RepC [unclassified Mesorhizobium]MDG4890004.1 plasmid replication protein RepC [Mesorhizobium sp. WSM4887]MDG4904146.1 plasmid replication protein RepC [Mesorhizobium sp. WSM4962]MDG4909173.1 plasmid replication protein RepC [Mesorhizobium sp. WSM4898]MDG4921797.1 plasmid replication protein RepC [Mesorhizobium sp. WSM4989]